VLEQLAFTRWFSRRYGTAVGAVCFGGVLARMLLAALLGLNGALGRSATLGPYERVPAALHTSFLAIPYTRLFRLAEGLILAFPLAAILGLYRNRA
jgi:hypothetical protein